MLAFKHFNTGALIAAGVCTTSTLWMIGAAATAAPATGAASTGRTTSSTTPAPPATGTTSTGTAATGTTSTTPPTGTPPPTSTPTTAPVDPETAETAITILNAAAPTDPNAANEEFFTRERWPAQRVLFLLPLRLGDTWNMEREWSTSLLPEAERRLQLALQATGKFSTTQVHRYNPILLRAVQDKAITKEQATALSTNPTVAGVRETLANLPFEQYPLIAEFTLDELLTAAGSPSPTVTTRVTGKLYEINNSQPVRMVVATSAPQSIYSMQTRGNKKVLSRSAASVYLLETSNNAFTQIARELVKPVPDISLPEPTMGGIPGSMMTTPAVITVPPGQVLGTFKVPRRR